MTHEWNDELLIINVLQIVAIGPIYAAGVP